jgi:4-hydroxy-tetrahydrodipicolinate reductase
MADQITVLVAGAAGRMGAEVVRAVHGEEGLRLVAAVDLARVGDEAGIIAGLGEVGVTIQSDLAAAIDCFKPRVMVDFTIPTVVLGNVLTALNMGVTCVVGTTGIDDPELAAIQERADAMDGGCLIAPNFAMGAVLMMKFAQEAAKRYEWAEIVEYHHEKKLDKPSGTAMRTALMMAEVNGNGNKLPPIHSVRLPGYVASQEVIFGAPGETFKLRHDSIDRKCFMPGVIHAVKEYKSIRGLMVGLETLL